MKSLAIAIIAAGSVIFAGAPAGAQSFPVKPIRIVVPFPPGGTSDILSRLIGPKLTEKWGQPVVVESRPGAAGAIAMEVVAKSAPDGYTLVLTDVGTLVILPALYSKTPYSVNDFAPITTTSYSPHLLCVHPNVPVTTVPQLIALAKKRPGALNYASSPARAPYLAGLQFADRTGRAGTALHHHRLSPFFRELGPDEPRQDVGGAARRERHHDTDGAGRIGLS